MAREQITEHLRFQDEKATDLFTEAKPLLEAHWREIATWQDIPLDPEWEMYTLAEDAGHLRTYTFRDHGELKGYAVFFVRQNLHYRGSRQANQDIIWVSPEYRKQLLGARFLQWCDEQLRADGVQVVSHHVKLTHDFGPTLQRLGYQQVEAIWQRRLDQGV